MHKTFRPLSIALAAALLFVALAATAGAHPPSAVNLEYDPETRVLTVTTPHSVGDPTDHYIDVITVSLNGEEIITQYFFTQISAGEQEALYLLIDAESGDTITVLAECNRFGDAEASLTLE